MQIFFTVHFKKQLKALRKKFPSVVEDLLSVMENIDLRRAIALGREIYKMRIKSSDTSKGKSAGFRVYVYFFRKKDLLVPLVIYHKSQKSTVSVSALQHHCDQTILELARMHL